MNVFNHYARYYDLLYADKDYTAEARFVHDQLARAGVSPGRLLELGCGTGRHAVALAGFGWTVDGLDLSEVMVSQARKRATEQPPDVASRLLFQQGDVRSANTGRTYDGVVSLFHVMSYQTTNADLAGAVATASRHLGVGGVFFFDFWYGPAVLSDQPQVRVKRLEDESIRVVRLAEPGLRANENHVQVNYQVFICEKGTQEYKEVRESHQMRNLFLPELEGLLLTSGLTIRSAGRWMSESALGPDSWYGWICASRLG
jgi:SAM-dependent methyltransferase